MDVKDYLAEVPDDRKETVNAILQCIRNLYPDAAESMRYKMPTFESDTGWVAVANQKNYVSVYTCMPKHLEKFKKAHPKIKTGKGCINFKPGDSIPFTDLENVIHSAMEHGK